MKVSIDTREDSHDDIKKVIKMLQHIVGDSQEIFTNEPSISASASEETQASPLANIFGDTSVPPQSSAPGTPDAPQEAVEGAEETSDSTDDLFAELFSEEELKKMDIKKDEEEVKPAKGKKYDIELY